MSVPKGGMLLSNPIYSDKRGLSRFQELGSDRVKSAFKPSLLVGAIPVSIA